LTSGRSHSASEVITMRARVPVLLVAVACLPLVADADCNAQPLAGPAVRVGFTAVMEDHVSGLTWTAMVEECRRIWKAEGVSIGWDARDPTTGRPDVQVPVLFDEQALHKRAHADAFGVTVFSGRKHRVIVSEPRVRHWVSNRMRHRLQNPGDSTVLDAAVGRVLGRVLAHELGHVLLQSKIHAETGLMSASLQAADLDPSTQTSDALSVAERTYLAIRFSNSGGRPPRPELPPPVLARGTAPGSTVVVPILLRDPPGR
jgi:hypothetical protein